MAHPSNLEDLLAWLDCECIDDLATEEECHCSEVNDHLYELLDEEMSTADARRLLAHIVRCGECEEALDEEFVIRYAVHKACGYRAPESLRLRLLEKYGG